MVSLPEDLLLQLDAEARRRSVTRSGLLAAAARTELARRDPDVKWAAVRRMEELAAQIRIRPAGDAASWVRADRDERDQRDRGRV